MENITRIDSVQKGMFGKDPDNLKPGVFVRYRYRPSIFNTYRYRSKTIICESVNEQERVFKELRYKHCKQESRILNRTKRV